MEYKALMLDVDGTLIPYEYDALPSKKVIEAIEKAKERVHIVLVTGRAYNSTAHILQKLKLDKGYVVNNAGGIVIDLATKKTIYEKPLDTQDANFIIQLLLESEIPFYVKDNPYEGAWGALTFNKNKEYKNPFMIFTADNLSLQLVDTLFKKISVLPNITFHKNIHKEKDKCGINITHAQATKLHGIVIVSEKLGIKREEIIGVGDGYNDFPLLMASGLKVAMGNANNELKEIADFITLPVDEDGVAHVIEKYILSEQ